jgi:Lamin Tail Domain
LPGATKNQPIDYASDHTPVVAEFSLRPPTGQPTIPVPPPSPVLPIISPPPDPTTQPPLAKVRIVALLPNPPGDDPGKETIMLKNFGGADEDLTGWRLMDKAGNELVLSGSIAQGSTRVITLAEGQVPLNNGGDEVRLFDDDGVLQDRVRYAGSEAQEGVTITFAH